MERNGQAKAVYVAVPASLDRKGGTFLVLVRADLNVLRWIVPAAAARVGPLQRSLPKTRPDYLLATKRRSGLGGVRGGRQQRLSAHVLGAG